VRRLLLVPVCGIAICLCAGCGSSAPSAPPSSAGASRSQTALSAPSQTAPSVTAPAAPGSGSGLKTIGTASSSGDGWSISLTYAVGSLLSNDSQSNPPATVVSAIEGCGYEGSTNDAAYVPGTVTVKYTGNLPITISSTSLDSSDVVTFPNRPSGNDPGPIQELLELAGQWCNTQQDVTLPSGSSVTLPIVVFAPILTQSQPTLTTADISDWGFLGQAVTVTGLGAATSVSLSGPNAVTCEGASGVNTYDDSTNNDRIGMFETPPYTISGSGDDGTETYNCTAAGPGS